MAIDNYMDQFVDHADRFANLGLNAFILYEKVLGTEVNVMRVKTSGPEVVDDTVRYQKLLKSAMNLTESNGSNSQESFTTRILINKSQFSAKFMKSVDEFQVTYTSDRFNPGDLISFKYLGYNYRFKVMPLIESFGLQDGLMYRMTLEPYRETK